MSAHMSGAQQRCTAGRRGGVSGPTGPSSCPGGGCSRGRMPSSSRALASVVAASTCRLWLQTCSARIATCREWGESWAVSGNRMKHLNLQQPLLIPHVDCRCRCHVGAGLDDGVRQGGGRQPPLTSQLKLHPVPGAAWDLEPILLCGGSSMGASLLSCARPPGVVPSSVAQNAAPESSSGGAELAVSSLCCCWKAADRACIRCSASWATLSQPTRISVKAWRKGSTCWGALCREMMDTPCTAARTACTHHFVWSTARFSL